jgi:hypothetical protein
VVSLTFPGTTDRQFEARTNSAEVFIQLEKVLPSRQPELAAHECEIEIQSAQ